MAQRTLIEILLPELRAYATAICQSRDAAEDLVQDAVERGLRSDRRPELLEELRPWMFRVIRNLHYDELRKRRVRREYSAEEKRLSDEAGGPDTARDVLIRLAFEKLPPETREPAAVEEDEGGTWQGFDRATLMLLGALLLAVTLFRSAYEQVGNTVALWANEGVDRTAFAFEIPMTWFQSLNPMIVILLTPFLLARWRRQRHAATSLELGVRHSTCWRHGYSIHTSPITMRCCSSSSVEHSPHF